MESVQNTVCSFSNLYKSAQVCRRNVNWKDSVAHFTNHSLASVYRLQNFLRTDTYKISEYSRFEICEPKLRKITSTRFKDRVFQRSLCDNYLTKVVSKDFIPDNYACQKNKGTDRARECLERHLKAFYSRHQINGYILKVDIHDYFGSTQHTVAISAMRKRIPDPWALTHVVNIINSFENNNDYSKGIGLGSQVSQLIQLAVLDDLDHFITQNLHIKLYVRYMDDFILIHHSKKYLIHCLHQIIHFLRTIFLEISPKKTKLFKVTQPIKFLGFSFKLHPTGKVTKRITPDNIKRERRKLRKLIIRVKFDKMTLETFEDCYQSWRAFVKKTDSRGQMLKMDRYKNKLKEETLYAN